MSAASHHVEHGPRRGTARIEAQLADLGLPTRLVDDLLVAFSFEIAQSHLGSRPGGEEGLFLVPRGWGGAHLEWIDARVAAGVAVRLDPGRPGETSDDHLEKFAMEGAVGVHMARLQVLKDAGAKAGERMASYLLQTLVAGSPLSSHVACLPFQGSREVATVVEAWAGQEGLHPIVPTGVPGSLLIRAADGARRTVDELLRAYPPPPDLAAATLRLTRRP